MKTATLTTIICLCSTGLVAGVQSVHTVVLCAGGRPNVAAYFEQASSSNPAPQSCRFLYLAGDSTPQQRSVCLADIQTLGSLTLTSQPSSSTRNGLRTVQVDGQGHVRRVIWTSAQGVRTEVALFDSDGHILRLDKWRNQTVVPDVELKPLLCGPSAEQTLNLRVFNSTSGNIEIEAKELEFLADTVTNYALVHDLGLTITACSNPTEGNGPMSALTMGSSASVGSPSKITSFPVFSQALVVAPNPADGQVLVFYQLPAHFQDVRILIYSLAGKKLRSYNQGDENSGDYQVSVNLGALPAGIYFVFLSGGNGSGNTVVGRFKLAVR